MKRAIILLFLLLLACRLLAAARQDLFGDEAFYWQCSRHLDWGYADHPFMTALLVRAGTALLGDTTLGVRALFLLLGSAWPVLVFLLARPLVGAKDAWLAAGATLILPATALALGWLAVPDVPAGALLLIALLATLAALRRGRARDWLLAGLVAALGLSTHYRFVLFVAAVGAFLVLSREGRARLGTPGPWLGLAATSLGLAPILLFNVAHDFAPLRYQLLQRHGGGTDLMALLDHLREQALVVTPLLYLALLAALWKTWRRAREGDAAFGLLLWVSLLQLGTYFVLSPWSDSRRDHIHWPLPGYLPLLVLLPSVLRDVARRSRVLAWITPGLAGVGVGALILELATGWLGVPFLRTFQGWSEMSTAARSQLERLAGAEPVLVGDSYITAAELAFTLGESRVYTLDHEINTEHGRGLQYRIWGLDEAGLARRAGEDALVVLSPSEVKHRLQQAWRDHAASLFARFACLQTLSVDTADEQRDFALYLGQGIPAGGAGLHQEAAPVPEPPR